MQADNTLATYSNVGTLLDQFVSSGVLPGASVLVLRDGKEAFCHVCGMMDLDAGSPLQRDTLFRIYSMTKPITAAAIMILVDEGRLRLEDPISNYIPEFSDLGVYEEGHGAVGPTPVKPTIRQLLTHTAGFSYWFYEEPVGKLYAQSPGVGPYDRWCFDPAGLDGLARSLARLPLVGPPGERWHYSMSLDVAGIVIERVTGNSLGEFMKTKMFDPLGMRDTGFSVGLGQGHRLASLYVPKPEGGLELLERGSASCLLEAVPGEAGGGGLLSTIDDYGRFAEMLRCGGVLGGSRILSAESARAIMTNQLEPAQLFELPVLTPWGLGTTGDGLGFGLGGAVAVTRPANGVPVFAGEYSWGGGASTAFWIDPLNRLTVVFMTQLQRPSKEMFRDKLHWAVYSALNLVGDVSEES